MAIAISDPSEPPRKIHRKDDGHIGAVSDRETIVPDELWEHIFYYATDNPARREWEAEGPVDLPPFDIYLSEKREQLVTEAIRTKSSISLVSSKWRKLSARFLYEDIRIRQGSMELAVKLESRVRWSRYSDARTFGHLVRRATMGVDMRARWRTSLEPGARRILLACPKLVSLVRRSGLSFRQSDIFDNAISRPTISDVRLPRLRHLEWDNAPVTSSADAPEFLWNSSKLEVVSLVNSSRRRTRNEATFPWGSTRKRDEDAVAVAGIHTLRLDCALCSGMLGRLSLSGVTLTSLNRLILNVRMGRFEVDYIDYQMYWTKYGRQLRTVELSVRVTDFIKYMDRAVYAWGRVLRSCPNLETLHCHISNFPFGLEGRLVTNRSIREVMVHAGREDVKASLELASMACFSESLIRLCGDNSCLPNLERLKFHGSGWPDLIGDNVMAGLKASALRGNVEISFVGTEL